MIAIAQRTRRRIDATLPARIGSDNPETQARQVSERLANTSNTKRSVVGLTLTTDGASTARRPLASSGMPLESSTRAHFEDKFRGYDLSNVRIHRDNEASLAAGGIYANAYTLNNHIVFGRNRYSPSTTQGRYLLGHELTHVIQQRHNPQLAGKVQRDASDPFMNAEDVYPAYLMEMTHGRFNGIATILNLNFVLRGFDTHWFIKAFSKVPSGWQDNVGAEFTSLIKDDAVLDKTAESSSGRRMLTVLYEAIMTGDVSDFERTQGTRLLDAKARRIAPEDYAKAMVHDFRGNATQIFPVRNMRITPGYDDAPLMAELRKGQVWARYPARVQHADTFRDEVRTLRGGTFNSEGQLLNPNEIIGIKNYEDGGKISYLPALALIDYSNRVKSSTLGKVRDVSIAAATVGIGGPAAAGGEAATTRAAVWGARLKTADQVASVIQVVHFFVDENREWIADTLGWPGKLLIKGVDAANSIAAIYGLGRLAQAGWGIARDLRKARTAAVERAAQLKLGEADAKKLEQLNAETDKLIAELEAGSKPVAGKQEMPSGAADAPLGPSPRTGRNSQPAELDVPGPHPFFRKPAANHNVLPPTSNAAENVALKTGTDDLPVAQHVEGHVNENAVNGPKMAKKSPPQNKPTLAPTPQTQTAKPLGQSEIKPSKRADANVDVAVQKHSEKTDFRERPGTAVQSAHMNPSSAMRDLENYLRNDALTVLMPRELHAAFDNYWKAWSKTQVAAGRKYTTVEHFIEVLDQAANSVPGLKGRTSGAMSWLFRIEAYSHLGLKPNTRLRLPYSK